MEVLDLAGGIGLVVGVTSACASAISGEVVHVDAGFHVEGMVFH